MDTFVIFPFTFYSHMGRTLVERCSLVVGMIFKVSDVLSLDLSG